MHEGLYSAPEALEQLSSLDLRKLAIARFVGEAEPTSRGIGAAGGVAVGRVAFDTTAAQRIVATGDRAIIVRPDIATADVAGLAAASGVLSARGGRTAHASLVARQMGKACVVSCAGLVVDAMRRRGQIDSFAFGEGDWISIDGDSGEVFLGQREIVTERPEIELAEVERWRAECNITRVDSST